MTNKTLNEDSGSCEIVWFNSSKGYGAVRFVNTENTAYIFSENLPKNAKVGSLLNAYAKEVKAPGPVFWNNELVVVEAELQ